MLQVSFKNQSGFSWEHGTGFRCRTSYEWLLWKDSALQGYTQQRISGRCFQSARPKGGTARPRILNLRQKGTASLIPRFWHGLKVPGL